VSHFKTLKEAKAAIGVGIPVPSSASDPRLLTRHRSLYQGHTCLIDVPTIGSAKVLTAEAREVMTMLNFATSDFDVF